MRSIQTGAVDANTRAPKLATASCRAVRRPDGDRVGVLHLLGSAQVEETSLAHTLRVLARWPRNGYELTAWFTGEGGPGPVLEELSALGVDVRMRPWAGFRDMEDLRNSMGLARNLRRERFHIVHRHVGGRALPMIVRFSVGHGSYRRPQR